MYQIGHTERLITTIQSDKSINQIKNGSVFLVSRSERSRDSGSHNVCLSVCLYVCMSQTLIRFYSMNSSVNSSMISSINQKY